MMLLLSLLLLSLPSRVAAVAVSWGICDNGRYNVVSQLPAVSEWVKLGPSAGDTTSANAALFQQASEFTVLACGNNELCVTPRSQPGSRYYAAIAMQLIGILFGKPHDGERMVVHYTLRYVEGIDQLNLSGFGMHHGLFVSEASDVAARVPRGASLAHSTGSPPENHMFSGIDVSYSQAVVSVFASSSLCNDLDLFSEMSTPPCRFTTARPVMTGGNARAEAPLRNGSFSVVATYLFGAGSVHLNAYTITHLPENSGAPPRLLFNETNLPPRLSAVPRTTQLNEVYVGFYSERSPFVVRDFSIEVISAVCGAPTPTALPPTPTTVTQTTQTTRPTPAPTTTTGTTQREIRTVARSTVNMPTTFPALGATTTITRMPTAVPLSSSSSSSSAAAATLTTARAAVQTTFSGTVSTLATTLAASSGNTSISSPDSSGSDGTTVTTIAVNGSSSGSSSGEQSVRVATTADGYNPDFAMYGALGAVVAVCVITAALCTVMRHRIQNTDTCQTCYWTVPDPLRPVICCMCTGIEDDNPNILYGRKNDDSHTTYEDSDMSIALDYINSGNANTMGARLPPPLPGAIVEQPLIAGGPTRMSRIYGVVGVPVAESDTSTIDDRYSTDPGNNDYTRPSKRATVKARRAAAAAAAASSHTATDGSKQSSNEYGAIPSITAPVAGYSTAKHRDPILYDNLIPVNANDDNDATFVRTPRPSTSAAAAAASTTRQQHGAAPRSPRSPQYDSRPAQPNYEQPSSKLN